MTPPAREACEAGDNDELVAVVAALLGEPWCLPMRDVARLTLRQIYCLYLHPRDDKGAIKPRARDEGLLGPDLVVEGDDEVRLFFTTARDFGMPREKAEAEWVAKRGALPAAPWYEDLWR